MDFFSTANYVEAAFWGVVGAAFAVAAVRKRGAVRRECAIAAVTFVAFGWSDVVEVQTGAWFRPWWLLVWKGVCVLSLGRLLINYLIEKRRANYLASTSKR